MYILEEELGLCFIADLLYLDCISFVPAFPLLSLRSVITETCSRASIMAGLRSQNGLDQNGLSYVKKAMPGSLALGTPYPICLPNCLWWGVPFAVMKMF